MKKILATTLLVSLLSTSVMAGEFVRKHGEALGMSYIGASIFLGVYATTGPAVGMVVGVSTLASVTKKEIEANKREVAKMLLNDLQDYYQTGSLTASLGTTVVKLKETDNELSEAEALDILQEAAESILN